MQFFTNRASLFNRRSIKNIIFCNKIIIILNLCQNKVFLISKVIKLKLTKLNKTSIMKLIVKNTIKIVIIVNSIVYELNLILYKSISLTN